MTTQMRTLILAPFGAVAIQLHGNQLVIDLLGRESLLLSQTEAQPLSPKAHPFVKRAYQSVTQYFQQPSSLQNLSFYQQGTAFQQRVWQAIAEIPSGQTRSYSELAVQVGSGARAVANACGANKLPLLVPCHRVLAKHGIGGFMQGKQHGLLIKQWLLQHEAAHRVDCE